MLSRPWPRFQLFRENVFTVSFKGEQSGNVAQQQVVSSLNAPKLSEPLSLSVARSLWKMSPAHSSCLSLTHTRKFDAGGSLLG